MEGIRTRERMAEM